MSSVPCMCTLHGAIGHLLHNPSFAHKYNERKFSVLAHGRTPFHLFTLEATSKPDLCKYKKFVCGHKLSHLSLVPLGCFRPIGASAR